MISYERRAFTLIEVLIVIVIIGSMVTMVPPWFLKKRVNLTISSVLREFNNLLLIARQYSVENQQVCRLLFKSEKNSNDYIIIQSMERDPENPEKLFPKPIISEYLDTKYSLPKKIKMKAIYLNRKELFYKNKGEAYCYISPNSLIEGVMIYISHNMGDFERRFTFKVEPFLGEFELYNDFLKK